MKRVITFILIAVSIILYAGCTDFSEDIKNLQAQIDALKSDQIKSIDEQVSSIKASLVDLQYTDKELQLYISQLQIQQEKLEDTVKDISEKIEQIKTEPDDSNKDVLAKLEEYKGLISEQIDSLKSTIETLQAKDKDLQSQIEILQDYIDSGIKDTKDWVSATFSTLDQYNATASIIATIQAQLETINSDISLLKNVTANVSKTDLDKAIASSESAIKDWVNSLLEGYYTAEQIEAKLAALKEELSKSGAGSVTTEYETKLATIKSEITEAYTAAITKAINDYDGTITSRIASEISTVNGKISSLRSDLAALESRVSSLENRVTRLEELVDQLSSSGTSRKIEGETTSVCGQVWMNYNLGASDENIKGNTYTFDESLTACPSGYRVPTRNELKSLIPNYSEWKSYNGVEGRWYSGGRVYTSKESAIFLPTTYVDLSSTATGYYWSSTVKENGGGYTLLLAENANFIINVQITDGGKQSVRCLQDYSTLETTTIDGVTWANYNLCANDENKKYGIWFSADEGQTACPYGYRLPTKEELESLSANYSDWTTYNGQNGRWFSGSQPYSSSVPAIFLPEWTDFPQLGIYLSSTQVSEGRYSSLNFLYSDVGIMDDGTNGYVRCVKQ